MCGSAPWPVLREKLRFWLDAMQTEASPSPADIGAEAEDKRAAG